MPTQKIQCATCGAWTNLDEVFRVPFDPDISGLMFCGMSCMKLGIQKYKETDLRVNRESAFPPQYASDLIG